MGPARAVLGRSAEAEDDADAPRAGYRDRIVVAVVVGLILIMAGAFVAIARGIPWSLPFFALGFGLVLTLDCAEPPLPACEPQPAADDRVFERLFEFVAPGRHPDRASM